MSTNQRAGSTSLTIGAVAGLAGGAELALFALSLLAMYSLAPIVLRRCGAAAFNIGMLTSDLWVRLPQSTTDWSTLYD